MWHFLVIFIVVWFRPFFSGDQSNLNVDLTYITPFHTTPAYLTPPYLTLQHPLTDPLSSPQIMSNPELHISEDELNVKHEDVVVPQHLTSTDPQPPHQVDTGGGHSTGEDTIDTVEDIDSGLSLFII